MNTLVLKIYWDPYGSSDLINGFTRGTEDTFNAFKVGSFVILWGKEEG